MSNGLATEFGPVVFCDYAEQESHTHRPSGSSDPWFCFKCGSTEHKEIS